MHFAGMDLDDVPKAHRGPARGRGGLGGVLGGLQPGCGLASEWARALLLPFAYHCLFSPAGVEGNLLLLFIYIYINTYIYIYICMFFSS